MINKIFIASLMITYLYVLTFGVFLTPSIRIPAPIVICLPLFFLYGDFKGRNFLYKREIFLFTAATFFAYGLVQSSIFKIIPTLIVVYFCILYFNYFVHDNWSRYKASVIFFYFWLVISSIIMLLNHVFPPQIDSLRVYLAGYTPDFQSPSGITQYIFSFGYQAASLTSFIFTFVIIYRRHTVIKIAVLIFALIIIYFGLQRSVLVTFSFASVLLVVIFYRFNSLWILGFAAVIFMLVYSTVEEKTKNYDNIFAKNERDPDGNRKDLVAENLKIITDYPYGLIFHGKTWSEATRNSVVFSSGITSHNAYLMFITYLGPFLGIGFLVAIYFKIWKLFKHAVFNIYDPKIALLICLCFSFLSVSLNSMSHNAWLLNGNGPTIFLYFAIIHFGNFFLRQRDAALDNPK